MVTGLALLVGGIGLMLMLSGQRRRAEAAPSE
jgi:hypothetical protein